MYRKHNIFILSQNFAGTHHDFLHAWSLSRAIKETKVVTVIIVHPIEIKCHLFKEKHFRESYTA